MRIYCKVVKIRMGQQVSAPRRSLRSHAAVRRRPQVAMRTCPPALLLAGSFARLIRTC